MSALNTREPELLVREDVDRLSRFCQRLSEDWNTPEDGLPSSVRGGLPDIFAILDEIIETAGRGEPDICPVDGDISVTWHLRRRCVLDICPDTLDAIILSSGTDTKATVVESEFNLRDEDAVSKVRKVLANAESL